MSSIREIGGGEVRRILGAAQGQCAQDRASAADGGDGGGADTGGLEQTVLFHRDTGIRFLLVGLRAGQSRGDPAQSSGQGHRRILRDRRHRSLKVLVVHQGVVLRVDDGGAPHLVALGDQIDYGPVRQPGHHQGQQPAQRLLGVERGREPGGGLGQQGEPLEFRQLVGRRLRSSGGLRRALGVDEHERAGFPAVHDVRRDQPRYGQQGAVPALEVVSSAWAVRPAWKACRMSHRLLGKRWPWASRCSRS